MTRTAKKADTPPAPAPAKKTTARKTAAKTATAKRTTAKPRTPRAATRKATGPALSLVKENPAADKATVVNLHTPLPVRRRHFVGTHTHAQITEARAACASAQAELPVPHILWLAQIDGRAAARLADGTLLVHTHERAPEFTAYLRCPTGGIHHELITNTRDLKAARTITSNCTRRHTDTAPADSPYDWHKAITGGVQQLVPARLSPLNVGLQTARKAATKTQPLPLDDIAEGLAARAADTETPKEHPQP